MADETMNPVYRLLYATTATKLFSVTHAEISRLTDDKLCDLVDGKLSELPADEAQLIVESSLEDFADSFLTLLSSLFPSKPPPAPLTTLPEQENNNLVYDHSSSRTWGETFFWGFAVFAGLSLAVKVYFVATEILCERRLQRLALEYPLMLKIIHDREQELLKHSKRSRSVLPAIVSKGLKGVEELHIRGTNMVLRQDLSTKGNRAASERQI